MKSVQLKFLKYHLAVKIHEQTTKINAKGSRAFFVHNTRSRRTKIFAFSASCALSSFIFHL